MIVTSILVATSITISLNYEEMFVFMCLVFIFGGCAFVLYPLAISHACDYLEESETLGAIAVITIFYGLGSIIGPIVVSIFMSLFGPFGFFIVMSAVSIMVAIYALYRVFRVPISTNTSQFTSFSPESVGFIEAKEVVSNKLSD
jgi:MFS family permease